MPTDPPATSRPDLAAEPAVGTRAEAGAASAPETDARQSRSGTISRRLVALLAIASGLAVANLYYAQPLLHELAGAFGASSAAAGLVVTVTQLGYAAGLLLLVPLGDLVPRRRLVVLVLLVAAVALAGSALAGSLAIFEAVALAVGCASVVAQVLVPMAADLAAPERRGQVVGTVMSGLLIGILLSRTLSGLVAAVAGWRTVYWSAAVAMLLLALTLRLALPLERRSPGIGYPALLRSTAALVRREPLPEVPATAQEMGMKVLMEKGKLEAFLLASKR